MTIANAYTDYPLVLDTETGQGGTAVYVNGKTAINMNLVTGVQMPGGEVYNSMAFLQQGEPVGNFQSPDIKEFIDQCGVQGMLIDSGVNGDGVIIFCQKYAPGGTRASGAVHHKTTIGDGLLIPKTLQLPHRGIGSLQADIIAISSDGALSPIAWDEVASLPGAVYPQVDASFTLGKIMFDVQEVEGIASLNITFGITPSVESADSDIYPSLVYIVTIEPTIQITGKHLDLTSVITEDGKEYAVDKVEFYARKRDEGGTFVADGVAEHIKFTLGKCRVDPMSIGGSPSADISYRITPWDAPGASPVHPITIDTASAIT